MGLSANAKTASKVMGVGTALLYSAYIALRVTVGTCARPELVQDFDSDAYLGIWYELRRDLSNPYESGECVTAQYSLNDDGSVKVDNNQYFGFTDDTTVPIMTGGVGQAQLNSFVTTGSLFVHFFAYFGGNYQIMDTDYTSYTVIHSCSDFLTAGIAYDT